MSSVLFGWLPSPLAGMALLQQGFVDSFFNFLTHDGQDRQVFNGYTTASSGYIPQGRNYLVRSFLDSSDADWLLMLDWDITYTPQDVYALLDAADENTIVSGTYVTYFGDDLALRPCWMVDQDGQEYTPVTGFTSGEIIDLTVCGMGFTIMHREAVKKIEALHPGEPWPWYGHDVIGGNRTGEDVSFCRRARQAGLSIKGHGGVMLGHTKTKTLVVADMLNSTYQTSVTNIDKSVLNLGAGGSRVPVGYEGWRVTTLDIDPDTGADVVLDARLLDTTDPEQYDAVYCSHTLEHFTIEDVPQVLDGIYHVLKPGGSIDVRVPDIGEVNRRLRDGACESDVAYVSPAGPITYCDIINGFGKAIAAGNEHMRHRTGFDEQSLRDALEQAGFFEVVVKADDLELTATGVAP